MDRNELERAMTGNGKVFKKLPTRRQKTVVRKCQISSVERMVRELPR